MQIDVTYDFRRDSFGKDPDKYSSTLRAYHKQLWSKKLPCGSQFILDDSLKNVYLHHRSALGEFFMSSDSIVPTFTRWKNMSHVTELFSKEENEAFRYVSYTIGGMIIFPSNRIDGQPTINVGRGFNRMIADRFDLTLECIRRYYLRQDSPLTKLITRYQNFFDLFYDFEGYVDYFTLQDLVSNGGSSVSFFTAFDNFNTPATPKTAAQYREYRSKSMEFVLARNYRIENNNR